MKAQSEKIVIINVRRLPEKPPRPKTDLHPSAPEYIRIVCVEKNFINEVERRPLWRPLDGKVGCGGRTKPGARWGWGRGGGGGGGYTFSTKGKRGGAP